MSIFEFKIYYYSELDETDYIDFGYVPGETISAAAVNLSNWYGEDVIESVKLIRVNDEPILVTKSEKANDDPSRPPFHKIIEEKNIF